MPIGVGIGSVPKLCQSGDLTDVNIFSVCVAGGVDRTHSRISFVSGTEGP